MADAMIICVLPVVLACWFSEFLQLHYCLLAPFGPKYCIAPRAML